MNSISTRSTLQILSLKGKYSFYFSNFPIIDLCNTSANCWCCIIAPPEILAPEEINQEIIAASPR